jgi:hypothetical protein
MAWAVAGVSIAGAGLTCMSEPNASFEKSVEVQPIDVRTIDILHTFPERKPNRPEKAEVGSSAFAEESSLAG